MEMKTWTLFLLAVNAMLHQGKCSILQVAKELENYEGVTETIETTAGFTLATITEKTSLPNSDSNDGLGKDKISSALEIVRLGIDGTNLIKDLTSLSLGLASSTLEKKPMTTAKEFELSGSQRKGEEERSTSVSDKASHGTGGGTGIPTTSGHEVPATAGHKVPATACQGAPATAAHKTPAPSDHKVPATAGQGAPATFGHKVPTTAGQGAPAAAAHKTPVTVGHKAPATSGHKIPVTIGHSSRNTAPATAGRRASFGFGGQRRNNRRF